MNTRQDLIEYIKCFNKKPGEYSLNDLLDIGTKMLELPKKQRSWKWLHKYLGITEFSYDAYRLRVIRSIPKENKESIEYRDNYSSKYKEREWVNAYRRTIREEIRIDNLIEEIKLAVSKINDLPPITIKPISTNSDKEAVLLLSDLHIGVDCDNYYNKYDKDIAFKRLSQLSKNIIKYCTSLKINKLNVLNLGDLIHGIIHTNARIENQMDVAEQIMIASEYISQFLNSLTYLGIEITYRSVYDNHSRAIADKNQHIEKEQFSRIIDWYIEERLKNTGIKFINDNIDGGIGKFKIFGKSLMFAHGHQDGRNGSFQNFIGLTKEWVDYICLAHYHNPAVKDYQGCKVFINGSIVGTEQYAFGRRLFSTPSQKLIIFEKNNENIIDIDIGLKKEGE